jgi:hypothetical protein
MTFKDLKKRVSSSVSQQQTRFFDKLQNKPFWIWDIEEHKQEDVRTKGDCCFNHIIGLPTKEIKYNIYSCCHRKNLWLYEVS